MTLIFTRKWWQEVKQANPEMFDSAAAAKAAWAHMEKCLIEQADQEAKGAIHGTTQNH